jgi:AcrR family transcriptional regulator
MDVKPSEGERSVPPVVPDSGAAPRSRKSEQAEGTRSALIQAARELFAQRGYAGVGTEEIVQRARVTRGALYHHFRGKEDLFRAVYEELERELVEQIAARAGTAADPFEALKAGHRAFLDACEDPAIQRITLLDAPSVLGWEQWREIGMRYGFGLVRGTLEAAMDAGLIERQPVNALSHLLLGAIDEAAMVVARADDGGRTRREVGAALDRYLDMLRAPDRADTGK